MAIDERQPLLNNSNDAEPEQQSNGKYKLVQFDPNGDADNPLEFPRTYQWCIVLLLAFMTFTVTFTCIGVVPVAGRIVQDLEGQKSKSASVLLVTIWELGEAAGPLFTAPLSELYGRYPVLNICNLLFIGATVMSALSQDSSLLIFARFLTGCTVASNVLSPAIIADVFPSKTRGSAMSIVMVAPLIGGAVGPMIGGTIAEKHGWRLILWVAVILAGVAEVLFLTLFRETYKVSILRRRAACLRKETGDQSYRTVYDKESEAGTASWIMESMMRPAKVFFSSFVLQAISLWGGLTFALFYVMSTTLPDILQDVYHLSPSLTGISFMVFSFGSVFGIIACNRLVDKLYLKLEQKHKGERYHEGRLSLPAVSAFALPVFVTFYGWIPGHQWPLPLMLLTVAVLGFFTIICIVPLMTYVTDIFGLYSASALTAVLITRCLMGTFLPLAVAPLIGEVGYGYGFLVIAAVCLVVAPIPVLVMRYGTRWRQRSSYTKDDQDIDS